ncbi:MAG TPA: hypothetical protein VMR45_01640 [Patescibacteria group bacterium]|nr:hypothetical protein [Patescibacteria group bacterium]
MPGMEDVAAALGQGVHSSKEATTPLEAAREVAAQQAAYADEQAAAITAIRNALGAVAQQATTFLEYNDAAGSCFSKALEAFATLIGTENPRADTVLDHTAELLESAVNQNAFASTTVPNRVKELDATLAQAAHQAKSLAGLWGTMARTSSYDAAEAQKVVTAAQAYASETGCEQ